MAHNVWSRYWYFSSRIFSFAQARISTLIWDSPNPLFGLTLLKCLSCKKVAWDDENNFCSSGQNPHTSTTTTKIFLFFTTNSGSDDTRESAMSNIHKGWFLDFKNVTLEPLHSSICQNRTQIQTLTWHLRASHSAQRCAVDHPQAYQWVFQLCPPPACHSSQHHATSQKKCELSYS